jgi:hypothetical protein
MNTIGLTSDCVNTMLIVHNFTLSVGMEKCGGAKECAISIQSSSPSPVNSWENIYWTKFHQKLTRLLILNNIYKIFVQQKSSIAPILHFHLLLSLYKFNSDSPIHCSSIVKSGILFSNRLERLKRILKSGILFNYRHPWLKSLLKSDMLFSHIWACSCMRYRNKVFSAQAR